MITVHGLLGEPSPDLARAAAAADWVVGGSRHLDRLAVPEQRRITLGALSAAVTRIAALPESDDVVVIASGDPLHYGVVRSLRAAGLRPRVVPGVGSIATAFARVGLPWDDAVVVSVHGRPLAPALAMARSHPKVAVFTSADNGIRELAAGLARRDRTFVLAERLGEPDEQVRVLDAAAAAGVEPLEPNVVLILAAPPDDLEPTTLCADLPGDRELVIGQVTSGPASLLHADRIDATLDSAVFNFFAHAVAIKAQDHACCVAAIETHGKQAAVAADIEGKFIAGAQARLKATTEERNVGVQGGQWPERPLDVVARREEFVDLQTGRSFLTVDKDFVRHTKIALDRMVRSAIIA